MYQRYVKRALDVLIAVFGLIIAAIPMLIVAVIIKIDSPGPVFFKQKRVGLHKTHFDILKFRSMSVKAPSDMPTHQFTNAGTYLTPWQRLMRKLSIDELPQLFNILQNDMSFVGPRPALWNQYDLIAERDKYGANDVKPGLTGWAQINGRDELEISEKAYLDGEYVKCISFTFDCRCFFGTFLKVLRSDGVVEGGTGYQKCTEVKEKVGKQC